MTMRDITNSPVSLRILIACMLFVGTGTWAVAVSYARILSTLSHLEKNAWTYAEEREAWREYANLNPGQRVPNVKDIHSDSRN